MQGSGKGTQGKILAERYGLKVFDMGSELRSIIASGSDLGNEIKTIVDRGDLVSDDKIMEVVETFLNTVSPDQRILFDGIPRTMGQSNMLMSVLKKHGRDAFALHIKISEKEAIHRLTNRRVCSHCKEIYPATFDADSCSKCASPLETRQDDSNIDSVKKRLQNFKLETIPVINQFYQDDHLIEVDGEQPIPDVTDEMIEKAGYLFD
jgi:adenylate kinase